MKVGDVVQWKDLPDGAVYVMRRGRGMPWCKGPLPPGAPQRVDAEQVRPADTHVDISDREVVVRWLPTSPDEDVKPEFRLRMMASRLRTERDAAKRRLAGELRSLCQRLEEASKDLEAGKPLPSFLIKNYMDIDSEIARWNLSVELLPFTVD
jgi:hypothetical protein